MHLQELTVLAVVSMIGLGALRLVRDHLGRAPLPEGRGGRLFLLAFLVGPPIAFNALAQPVAIGGQLNWLASLAIYVGIVATVVMLMSIADLMVGQLTQGRTPRLVRLALVGGERDTDGYRSDPPLTARLADIVAVCDRANAVFPRGHEFAGHVDRAGFRFAWDALDAATLTLEGAIADDNRLGRGVASTAAATAKDARGRLDTLRQLALNAGQAWAAA